MSEAREAPSASRTAMSLRRSSARARRKLARLVQASSSTSPTTTIRSQALALMKTSMGGNSRTSASGRSTNRPAGSQLSIRSSVSRVATAATAASAWGSDTPGLRRAFGNICWFSRLSNMLDPKSASTIMYGA